MLALPGFIEAHSFDPITADDGDKVFTVHYVLSDQAALDNYIENDAESMRAKGIALFGEALSASRSIRPVTSKTEKQESHCLNCDATLGGQYCWNCGQRGNTRLISLMELVRDAFGDMFELDSRLWRTLLPLAFRPGYLTDEYLCGRRARYMPPFRMYLVLSFVFFLITRLVGEGAPLFDDSATPPEGDVAISIGLSSDDEDPSEDTDPEQQAALAGTPDIEDPPETPAVVTGNTQKVAGDDKTPDTASGLDPPPPPENGSGGFLRRCGYQRR